MKPLLFFVLISIFCTGFDTYASSKCRYEGEVTGFAAGPHFKNGVLINSIWVQINKAVPISDGSICYSNNFDFHVEIHPDGIGATKEEIINLRRGSQVTIVSVQDKRHVDFCGKKILSLTSHDWLIDAY